MLNRGQCYDKSQEFSALSVSIGISLEYSTFHALDRCRNLHFQKNYSFKYLHFLCVCTPLSVSNIAELAEQLTVITYLCFYSTLKH